ncbi:MAG TPA: hypothetical protein VLE51_03510 [Candidatus Saccharimonadales bacterium]|nr:hypothetical protein [Candidatus Saccharimonadales bacterium]
MQLIIGVLLIMGGLSLLVAGLVFGKRHIDRLPPQVIGLTGGMVLYAFIASAGIACVLIGATGI